jgi:hypothetical protein
LSAPNEAVEIVPGDRCAGSFGEFDEGHVLLAMKYFDSKHISVKAEKVKELQNVENQFKYPTISSRLDQL